MVPDTLEPTAAFAAAPREQVAEADPPAGIEEAAGPDSVPCLYTPLSWMKHAVAAVSDVPELVSLSMHAPADFEQEFNEAL